MEEKDAAELADWAEHQMTLPSSSRSPRSPSSPPALYGAAAAEHGRSTLNHVLDEDHHPAEPDREHLAAMLAQARRGIAGAAESTPDQGGDER